MKIYACHIHGVAYTSILCELTTNYLKLIRYHWQYTYQQSLLHLYGYPYSLNTTIF